MRKFNKMLSSFIALSMLIPCFAINAFASQDRTMTLVASNNIDVEAGNIITIEVKLNNTVEIAAAGYQIEFDSTAFSIDTTSGGLGKPKKFIDGTWYSSMKNEEDPFYIFMNAPQINYDNGKIIVAWSPNGDTLKEYPAGIPAEYSVNDYVIGKYYLTVTDKAEKGKEYPITLTPVKSVTGGGGTNNADTMTLVNGKVTVKGTSSPIGQQIATGVYYVGAKELTGLSDNTKFVIKYETQTKEIEQTLGQILGGVGMEYANLQGKLHFAIKPLNPEANLDYTKFVIETK